MASDKQAGDFGTKLRHAREQRGLSLRVIADATKISVASLEALERNDISRLPGGIFSRGFVRAYAIAIGLDPEQMVAEFLTGFPHDSVTQGHPRTRAMMDELQAPPRRYRPTPGALALVAVPVLALLLYFGVVRRGGPVPQQPVPSATRTNAVPPPVAAEGFTASFQAIRPTTLTLSADGAAPTELVLDAGSVRSVSAARELLITPADPAAIQWTVNGRPARLLTGAIRLTRDTLSDFLVSP